MARIKTFVNGGSLLPADLDAIQDDYDGRLQAIETTGKLWQPGDLKPSAKIAPDTGWLLCDGSIVSRTTYAALFTAIGGTWGAGDGSTTFQLPDLRGRVPVGVGTATGAAGATAHVLGQKGGEETHVLTGSEMPSTVPKNETNGTVFAWAFNGSNEPTTPIDFYRGNGQAHNNMPPYAAVTWMVKT